MILLACDPGKTGAVACFVDGAPQWVRMMPLIPSDKGRDLLDVRTLATWLEQADHVVAERGQPMPMAKGGTIANYERGYGRGVLEGICCALVIPYTLVVPQRWQRVMLEGTSGDDTKQRSIVAARRLYPSMSLLPTPRSRKPSNGFSDALLIGGWYLRCLADRLNFGLT